MRLAPAAGLALALPSSPERSIASEQRLRHPGPALRCCGAGAERRGAARSQPEVSGAGGLGEGFFWVEWECQLPPSVFLQYKRKTNVGETFGWSFLR